ncbi:MAG TPA: L,D-transpeptidase family protein [Candidatus Angelobacter sp.]|nr:L,D-transpeptidase family protein [Candidatus Angelobacter sp.]
MKNFGGWMFGVVFLVMCAPALPGAPQSNQPLRADITPTGPSAPQFVVLKRNLSALIDAGRLTDLRWRNFTDYRSQLRDFYQPSDYALAWVTGNQPTAQALAMIQLLQNADKKGLRPDDYDAPRWADRIAHLTQSNPQGSVDDSVHFDLALTVSAMRYISDLHSGRINPRYFDFGLHVNHRSYKVADLLRAQVVNAKDLSSALEQVEPSFPAYRRTETALEHYLELQKQGDGQPVPVPVSKKSIKPGEAYDGVSQLAERLRRLGDLPQGTAVPADSKIYESALVEAVKQFQRRHGLPDDGALGQETFKQLNKPISLRVAQLQLALERWRWVPQGVQPPMVLVNIPEFHLFAYDDVQKPTLTMKVVVGRADEDHKTPVFADRMEYIIFRPYWKVPDSIILKEIIPAVQKDANYIAKHEYEMVDKQGTVIISDTVDADTVRKLTTGELDVRQKPGTVNALGPVKFVFPNSYDVYLHGTPERQLFGRSRRDFSHGCIRVEDPVALASWVLRDPVWTTDRILKAMKDEKKDAYQVNLKKPIPVLILYASAMVRENGEVDFYDDVYKQDADLQRALARGYPYPDCCDPILKKKKPPLIRSAAAAPPLAPAPAATPVQTPTPTQQP